MGATWRTVCPSLVSGTLGCLVGALVAVGAFAWSGCQSSKVKPEEESRIKEFEAELDIGRSMAGRLLQQFKPLDKQNVTAYVATVGQVVAKSSAYGDRTFVFGVLDTDQINAFAMPGGYIFITKGTLQSIANEAELAAVLGHEIAHIGKQHIFTALVQQGSGSSSKDSAKQSPPPNLEARKRPQSASSATASTLATVVSGGSAGSFNVLSAVQGGLGVLLERGLAPELEHEADSEGMQYAMAAGYDPGAMVSYFDRVLKKKSAQQLSIVSKTHPSAEQRIGRIKSLLATTVPKEYRGALGAQRYKEKATSQL